MIAKSSHPSTPLRPPSQTSSIEKQQSSLAVLPSSIDEPGSHNNPFQVIYYGVPYLWLSEQNTMLLPTALKLLLQWIQRIGGGNESATSDELSRRHDKVNEGGPFELVADECNASDHDGSIEAWTAAVRTSSSRDDVPHPHHEPALAT